MQAGVIRPMELKRWKRRGWANGPPGGHRQLYVPSQNRVKVTCHKSDTIFLAASRRNWIFNHFGPKLREASRQEQPLNRLRISAISYLNTAPLMWDFEH